MKLLITWKHRSTLCTFTLNSIIITNRLKRPLSVTIISCVFIIAGTVGIIYHARELTELLTQLEVIGVLIVRLLAIVGGWFALRGYNSARWVLVVWIAFHTVLSIYHSSAELAMHAGLTIITLIALFNKKANAYFNRN